MNFWEYKEDHSRGYYLPVSNRAARKQGMQFVSGLFSLVVSLFKLAGSLLSGIGSWLIITIPRLWKKYSGKI